jgi:hypothetical protein
LKVVGVTMMKVLAAISEMIGNFPMHVEQIAFPQFGQLHRRPRETAWESELAFSGRMTAELFDT